MLSDEFIDFREFQISRASRGRRDARAAASLSCAVRLHFCQSTEFFVAGLWKEEGSAAGARGAFSGRVVSLVACALLRTLFHQTSTVVVYFLKYFIFYTT